MKNVLQSILGLTSLCYVIINTLFWTLLLYPLTFLKLIIPIAGIRFFISTVMVQIAQNWISLNSLGLSKIHGIKWNIHHNLSLNTKKSYLVLANHQSWVDIVVLQQAFNRKIPFLRFFLKQNLIYVPLLGIAWWALDYPFMKRHSREYLEKYPEKRGEDLKTTQEACAKFQNTKVSILNFLEGTRFTECKHKSQKSEFKNLLKPKSGGVGFVISAMGDKFESILDVTITYPSTKISVWDLLCGRIKETNIHIREVKIPTEFLNKDYLNDEKFRSQFQNWLNQIWREKDQLISDIKKAQI